MSWAAPRDTERSAIGRCDVCRELAKDTSPCCGCGLTLCAACNEEHTCRWVGPYITKELDARQFDLGGSER